jgi:hypothetical protein
VVANQASVPAPLSAPRKSSATVDPPTFSGPISIHRILTIMLETVPPPACAPRGGPDELVKAPAASCGSRLSVVRPDEVDPG